MNLANIPTPEPDLTPDAMLERVRAMRPILRERQSVCEEIGRLPEETNREFAEAGFYRILQPRRFGGYEFDVRDFMRVMTEVSRGCSDSGWVLTLTAGHPASFLAGFEEKAQREVYGETGDARVPGAAMPSGTAIPAAGGYTVKGAWDYCSGCDIATHFLGGLMVIDPETKAPGAYGFVLCDREDFVIVKNWDVFGMQGTGSHRIVIEERILPAHRVLKFSDVTLQQWFPRPGRVLFTNPLYHGPFVSLLICSLVAVSVGAARGALDVYEQNLREKKSPMPPFPWRWEMPDFQHIYGDAQGLVDTAEAASLELASRYMEFSRRAMEGGTVAPEEERRFVRMGQECIHLAAEAVDTMFQTSRTSSAKKSSVLGRYFRNLAVIRTHAFAQTHQSSTNAARLRFGLRPFGPA